MCRLYVYLLQKKKFKDLYLTNDWPNAAVVCIFFFVDSEVLTAAAGRLLSSDR